MQHTFFVHFLAVVLHDYNVKVMLHKTKSQRRILAQHCSRIVSNGYNIVLTLQCCVVLKIVVANRPI